MANIGRERREIEITPIPIEIPVEPATPTPAPAEPATPAPQREPVPA